jgi:hypothetical protein
VKLGHVPEEGRPLATRGAYGDHYRGDVVSYLICARCQLTTYSEALEASTDRCPKCGEPRAPRGGDSPASVTPIAAHPRFLAAQPPETLDDGRRTS